MGSRNINELANVEFTGSLGEAFAAYSAEAKALGQRLAFELEAAASDAQAAMGSLSGHPLLFGLDCKVRARRVAKRLKRAQELAYGMGEEGRKFHRDYVRHIRPKSR